MDKEGVIKHINKLLDNKKVADIQKISLLEKWEVLTMKYFDEKKLDDKKIQDYKDVLDIIRKSCLNLKS